MEPHQTHSDEVYMLKLINGEDIIGRVESSCDSHIVLNSILRIYYLQDIDGTMKFTMDGWLPSDIDLQHQMISRDHCVVIVDCTTNHLGALYNKVMSRQRSSAIIQNITKNIFSNGSSSIH